LEDSGVDDRIVLRIFKKLYLGLWVGLYWLRIGTCEYGNEHSISIKCGKLLDWLKNC